MEPAQLSSWFGVELDCLQQCWEKLSERYLISIVERMCLIVLSEKGGCVKTLNFIHFSKNWKNGSALKLLIRNADKETLAGKLTHYGFWIFFFSKENKGQVIYRAHILL